MVKDRNSGRAMVLGDRIETESSLDTARLSIYDQAYVRLRSGN